MICRKCGSEISNQSFECPHCGASLLSAAVEETPKVSPTLSASADKYSEKKKKRSLIAGIVIIAVLVLAFVANMVVPPMLQSLSTVSQPDTTPSYDSLKFANLNNGGLATEDDSGNVYYTDSNGYIHRLETNGNDTVIYEKYAFGLTYANGRIYFITYENVAQSVCSMRTNGSELQTLIQQSTISYIFVQDNVLYYIENNSPTLPNRGAVYMYNLETQKKQNIVVENNSCILSAYLLNNCIYYYGYNTQTYGNFFKYVSLKDLQNKYTVKNSKNSKDIEPYTLTISDRTVYFIEQGNDFHIVSMTLDYCTPKYIGGSDCQSFTVYGHYIYYTTYANNALYRIDMKSNKTELVKDKGVLSPCCAGGKIYYRDSSTLNIMCVNLDGSGTHQI
ncbi:MAG: DUF5050 domain-containing protein [Acutalibacteraceae bacterium]